MNEVEISTIPHFLVEIARYPNICWMYRGQADVVWPLVPKAGRPEYFLPPFRGSDAGRFPPRDIARFYYWRELAVAVRKDLPVNDFECLAYAQHYGLATRLLDWSTNPLVALFFAVDAVSSSDGAVYCYCADGHIRSKDCNVETLSAVGRYSPPPFDARILLQAGVFSYHPIPQTPLAPGPITREVDLLRPADGLNLCRFRVPADMKVLLKQSLSEIGINRKSLFPDLDGLSDFVNWETRRSAELHRKKV